MNDLSDSLQALTFGVSAASHPSNEDDRRDTWESYWSVTLGHRQLPRHARSRPLRITWGGHGICWSCNSAPGDRKRLHRA